MLAPQLLSDNTDDLGCQDRLFTAGSTPLPSTTVSAAGNADTADVLMHKSEQLEQHLGAAESAGL